MGARPSEQAGASDDRTETPAFSPDGLMVEQSKPGGLLTRYAHDLGGNVTSVADPEATDPPDAQGPTNPTDRVTTYTYTADDLVASTVWPSDTAAGVRTETYGYDLAGRKTSTAASRTGSAAVGDLTFSYNPAGRMSSRTGRDGATISSVFDADGSPVRVADSSGVGSTVTSGYYLDGLVRTATTQATGGSAMESRHAYDAAGKATVRTSAAGETTTYVYNDAGKAVTTTSSAHSEGSWSASYDAAGRLLSEELPDAHATTRTYNADDTLASKKTTLQGRADPVSSWSYRWDGIGRVTTRTSAGDGPDETDVYGYDVAGRVTHSGTDGNSDGLGDDVASYDRNGNRLTLSERGDDGTAKDSAWSYNPDNSLASITRPGQAATPVSHTAFGATDSDGCSYAWDGFDRLSTTSGCADASPVPAVYDGLDRQLRNGGTDLAYDGLSTTVTAQGTAGVTRGVTLGAGGQPVATTKPGAGPGGKASQWLDTDGQGTVTSIIDAVTDPGSSGSPAGGGAAVSTACAARYNPWGEPQDVDKATSTDGDGTKNCLYDPTADPTAPDPDPTDPTAGVDNGTENDRWYRGERRDAQTGAYQLGPRTYDPGRAAFLSSDTYADRQPTADLGLGLDPLTLNRYSYVNGDPLNYTDPTGHSVACGSEPSDPCDPVNDRGDDGQHGPEAQRTREQRQSRTRAEDAGNYRNGNPRRVRDYESDRAKGYVTPEGTSAVLRASLEKLGPENLTASQRFFLETFNAPDGGINATFGVAPNPSAPANEVIVVRLFIPGDSAGLFGVLEGDNRGFSSDPAANSRVTAAFYPHSGLISINQTETCKDNAPDDCQSPTPFNEPGKNFRGVGNEVSVDEGGPGVSVGIHVLNASNEQGSFPFGRVDQQYNFSTMDGGGARVGYDGDSYPAQEVILARGDRAGVTNYQELNTGGYFSGSIPFLTPSTRSGTATAQFY